MAMEEPVMDYEAFLGLAATRRSIRNFTDEPVSDEAIEKILAAARQAPSGANSQPWEFIVVTDDETRKQVYEIYEENYIRRIGMEGARDPEYRFWGPHTPEPDPESYSHPLKSAPVYIIEIGDPRTTEMYNWAAKTNMRHELSNFYSGMANANFLAHLAAHSLGLGTKYNTVVGEADIESGLKQLLDIPDEYIVYEILAVGHYDFEPNQKWREDLDDLVHWGSYDRSTFRDDEEMDEYIKSKPMQRSAPGSTDDE